MKKCISIISAVVLSVATTYAQDLVLFDDTVAAFTGVSVSTPIEATVVCGSENRVVLRGNREKTFFTVAVKSGVLQVKMEQEIFNFFKHRDAVATITVAQPLNYVHASASADVTVPSCAIATDTARIEASSSADIKVNAAAKHIVIDASSSADVSLIGNGGNAVRLDATSSADVQICHVKTLIADASSSADVTYYKVDTVNPKTDSNGEIKHISYCN